MLFNSQIFILAFLPATLLLYYAAAEHRRLRQSVIVLASLLFYGWWDIRFVPLLAGLTVANWGIAQAFGRWRHTIIPTLGIGLNLAVLGGFKYLNFVFDNLAWAFGVQPTHWPILLPLGLSFFTFQKISYLADLKRGDRHVYGFLDFCMFVSFFPQLIAGPLVRHNEIIHQFVEDPRTSRFEPDRLKSAPALSPTRPPKQHTDVGDRVGEREGADLSRSDQSMWENLARGLALFTCGLVKKAVFADMASQVSDPVFAAAQSGAVDAAQAWVGACSYTLQIYFDFSGYSDMAIGLALMLGLTLPINFAAPYRSLSVRDFWRRWHITLSRFLRDYVYIPLGGNRCGRARQLVNVVVTMLLGGLWHGANWTFICWGGLHGLALAGNAAWSARGWRLPAPVAWCATMLFVIGGWVLFRAPDFTTAAHMLGGMAGRHGAHPMHVRNLAALLIAAACALLGPTSQDLALRHLQPRILLAIPVGAALATLLLLLGGQAQDAFIYFQF